jgi:hypothetical protein
VNGAEGDAAEMGRRRDQWRRAVEESRVDEDDMQAFFFTWMTCELYIVWWGKL